MVALLWADGQYEDARRRALDVGSESFIAKPFDLDLLIERVAGLVAEVETHRR